MEFHYPKCDIDIYLAKVIWEILLSPQCTAPFLRAYLLPLGSEAG